MTRIVVAADGVLQRGQAGRKILLAVPRDPGAHGPVSGAGNAHMVSTETPSISASWFRTVSGVGARPQRDGRTEAAPAGGVAEVPAKASRRRPGVHLVAACPAENKS